MSRVQVCSDDNAGYLLPFAPELKGRIDTDFRAVLNLREYRFAPHGRQPDTILFVGNFRHTPNIEALYWFTNQVFEYILQAHPAAQLIVVGNAPPPSLNYLQKHPNIQLKGFVSDVREPFEQYSVFVCPVLSGSGIRVKLLEAFASGIPVVSTAVGAEGLASVSGEVCELAESPKEFANSVVKLLREPTYAEALAYRARHLMEEKHDSQRATQRLVALYRQEASRRRKHTIDEEHSCPVESRLA